MIRLGRAVTGGDIKFDIYDSDHTLVTGKTRSGKSVCLYSILYQLPPEVKICGIDPTGIVFNAIGLNENSEFVHSRYQDIRHAVEVVGNLVSEMDKRIDTLLDRCEDKFSSDEFSPDMPLLVVVLEEYPSFLMYLSEDDKANGRAKKELIEPKIKAGISRLALEGLKVGIRLIIIGQRADASYLTGIMRAQLTNKISFRLDDEGLRMLFPGIGSELIREQINFAPGEGMVELEGRLSLQRFTADYIDYASLIRNAPGAEGV